MKHRNPHHSDMKTRLNINDSLLAQAKAFAAEQQTSLTRLVEEGLRLRLRGQKNYSKKRKQHIYVYQGRGGVMPQLNPLSNKATLDILDKDI